MTAKKEIGVSPAYFFSRFTTNFTPHDYITAFETLQKNGFSTYQPEIYSLSQLNDWARHAQRVHAAAKDANLRASQFVAHFLMKTVEAPEIICSDFGIEEFKKAVDAAAAFTECAAVTLPLAPLKCDRILCADEYTRLWDSFCRKIRAYARIVEKTGKKLALEIVPGSIMSNTDGFLRYCSDTGDITTGINFDTGHVWNCREPIETVPAKLSGRIYGTHLKDINSAGNVLPPGKGNIPWKKLLTNLSAAGYTGSFDLEIPTADPADTEPLYLQGKTEIETLLDTIFAGNAETGKFSTNKRLR